jgi:signal transduction histidine kinase
VFRLSGGAESGSFAKTYVVRPLLMECDPSGRVVRMSDHATALSLHPNSLLDIVSVGTNAEARLWQVFQGRESSVYASLPPTPEIDNSQDLAPLAGRMVGHLLRLVLAERRLFLRARPKRPGGGRKAIRQIEMERRRLGRELHTGAGQALAAIRIQLELIAAELPSPPDRVREALDRIGTLAGNTLEQVRSISRNLHPPDWQRLTLQDALRQLWILSGVPDRLEGFLELDPLPYEPDLEVRALLYRTAQEGLSNLIRHARATKVSLLLQYRDGRITLSIKDNGIGFDVDPLLRRPLDLGVGIGLRSIREQAEDLGGTMAVESSPYGTTLIVSVAISPAEG